MEKALYDKYIEVLNEELITALGCTEPIAIALAAAVARKELGKEPDKIIADCSGNIIKNVKGVTVPNSGGQKGVEVAAVLGAIAGNCDNKLEVLTGVSEADIERSGEMVKKGICEVNLIEGVANLYVGITVKSGNDYARAEILDKHTNVVTIERNGIRKLDTKKEFNADTFNKKRDFLSLNGIFDFIDCLDVKDVENLLMHQIELNTKIAEEGMKNDWGVNYGKKIIKFHGDSVQYRAMAYAAAGSDARMSGCDLGVVINSGSGNQGITVTLPIVEYAKELKVSKEKMLKALALANLLGIYLKKGIGSLSAFCGAVSAGSSAGAAITYMKGGTREQIAYTLTNALGNIGGMICDGAKSSCAAKVATSIHAALIASEMAFDNDNFKGGEGIIMDDPELTIRNIARLGRVGMAATDVEILNMMIGK